MKTDTMKLKTLRSLAWFAVQPQKCTTSGSIPRARAGCGTASKSAIINPVVDGLFYHVVKHEGKSWAHYGRFIRLDRGRAIEHTWVSEATRVWNRSSRLRSKLATAARKSPCVTRTCPTTSWAEPTKTAGVGT